MKRKRKKSFFFFLFALFLFGCFICRHSLLRGTLSLILPSALTYESLEWQGGRVLARGIHLNEAGYLLHIDEAELSFHSTFRPLYLETRVKLSHPEVCLTDVQTPSNLPIFLLMPTRFLGVKLEMTNGVFTLPNEQRFYFSFQSGETKEKIGELLLSSDPTLFHLPLLQLNLSAQEKHLSAELKVDELVTPAFCALVEALDPSCLNGWRSTEGVVRMEAQALFAADFSLCALDTHISSYAVDLYHPKLGVKIHAPEVHGKFSLPHLVEREGRGWQELTTALTVVDAELYYQNNEQAREQILKKSTVELIIEPRRDPVFNMSALLCRNERELSLKIKGAGSLQEEGAFWMALHLDLQAEQGSFMHALLSVCSPQVEDYILQVEIQKMGPEFFALISPWRIAALKNGELSGKIVAEIVKNRLEKLHFEDVHLRQVDGDLFSECTLKANDMEIAGEVSQVQEGWKFNQLFLICNQFSLQRGAYALDLQQAKCAFEENQLTHLSIDGAFNQVDVHVEMERTLDFSQESYTLVGRADLQKSGKLEFGCELSPHPLASLVDLRSFIPSTGWLHAQAIPARAYEQLIHRFAPQVQIEAAVDLQAVLNQETLDCSIESAELVVHHPSVDCYLPKWGEAPAVKATLTYDFKTRSVKGELPILQARIVEKETGLQIHHIQGLCKIHNDQISLEELHAECERVAFSGRAHLSLQGQNADLILQLHSFSADIADFQHLLQHLQLLPSNIARVKGRILSQDEGFTLCTRLGSPTSPIAWCFKGQLKEGYAAFPSNVQLTDLSCSIEADSHAQNFAFTQGQGSVVLADGSIYALHLPQAIFRKERGWHGEFDLNLSQNDREAVSLGGRIDSDQNEEIVLRVDPLRSHVFQSKILNGSLSWDKNGTLLVCDGRLSIPGHAVPAQLKFLKQCGLLTVDPLLFNCEGEIILSLHFKEIFSFEAESKRLFFQGKPYQNCRIQGEKHGAEWRIKNCTFNDLLLKAHLLFENHKVLVSFFEMKTGAAWVQGDGVYDEGRQRLVATAHAYQVDLAKLTANAIGKGLAKGRGRAVFDWTTKSIEGEASLEVQQEASKSSIVISEKNVIFTFSPSKGLHVKRAELFFPSQEMHLRCDRIWVDPLMQTMVVKKADIQMQRSLFASHSWEVKELTFSREPEGWSLSGQSAFQERPLFLQLRALSTENLLSLQIKENPNHEGVKLFGRVSGKQGLQLHSVRGKVAGLDVDLKQLKSPARILSGSVKMDIRHLALFFPQGARASTTLFKLGKGFELVGDFAFPQDGDPEFRGALCGRDFECLGFVFDNLHAQAEISLNRATLKQLSIKDAGGQLHLQLLKLDKLPTGEWYCTAPLVQVQELCPSLLTRDNGKPQEVKPLVIRRLSLSDLRGQLGMPMSFRAKGHLNFTNAFKKESSLFDQPFQFIKNLGLDPDLLIPVYGEIDLELKGAKFCITQLKNAYSEARRSEFYLSEERTSFIDLQGNVYVDIKMKQNVALKLVEPFILKVRGTIEKPRLSL